MPMYTTISKQDLREAVQAMDLDIYSTANIAGNAQHPQGLYRMSIWFHDRNDRLRNRILNNLVRRWPQLRGNIHTKYHVGSGVYLSLRVDNTLLKNT